MNAHLDPQRRHDFAFLFDVTDGNPNGDPDAGNLPRVDPETMQGLVTDVCIKRKIRDFVDASRGTEERYKIYVERLGVLNNQHERAYQALDLESTGAKQDLATIDKARTWMCANFYDVRTFGAVMTTGVNCGQVRGPLQLTFARSVDPIVPMDLSITRVAVTRPEDAVQLVETDDGATARGKQTEMGRKAIVPYGLYLGFGFYNPMLAAQTGFDADDLALFWQALTMCWDLDRSASRGLTALRGLYVFSHENRLGNAPAHTLLDRIRPRKRDGVDVPRAFSDYEVLVDEDNLPAGVTLTRLVG
ncbi:type I-C CRISPR-associated protein Cas7/Csd2 [Rhodocaloribacter litoris]|uniref:type I-C CRISPR-associated protein Cas7/Csd2 n=1 Tax=Rhodocaloribacter litoris TaxID=2558931 RepID=UPI00141F0A51|nr:type I-C CRISPR-associated protein Cas7/Csd2 [Rhodocaloribacter litoris]QXD14715.1 type I-C CRISPR-associated protein Cas7/Csd2 [Rhodocaloribacter litoris]